MSAASALFKSVPKSSLVRAPASSLMPLSRAYNSLSTVYPAMQNSSALTSASSSASATTPHSISTSTTLTSTCLPHATSVSSLSTSSSLTATKQQQQHLSSPFDTLHTTSTTTITTTTTTTSNALETAPTKALAVVQQNYSTVVTSAAHLPNGAKGKLPTMKDTPARNLTGAGVILYDRDTECIILFQNVARHCYEEPGGFLKPNYDAATSACMELFEESCTLFSKNKTSFLPGFVDVSGRSHTTTYRGFFMDVENPPTNNEYLRKRSQLERDGYPSDYLETKGMVYIPIHHLSAVLNNKEIDFELNHSTPVSVKDIYGVEVPVSRRTLKIFKQGGLDVITNHVKKTGDANLSKSSSSSASSSSPSPSPSSSTQVVTDAMVAAALEFNMKRTALNE